MIEISVLILKSTGGRGRDMRNSMMVAALCLAGCNQAAPLSSPATLYRNSPLDVGLRVHFASFDAPDSGDFNFNNCGMVARLLNA